MVGFCEVIADCEFHDLGFTGIPYTWDNRQDGNRNIKVRLDRGLGDDQFMELFDNSSITHVETTELDHCALIISITKSDWAQAEGGNRPFRFENVWTRHVNYIQSVEDAWVPTSGSLQEVSDALGGVRDRLRSWSREEFGFVKKQLKSMRQRLEYLRENSLWQGPTTEERRLVSTISKLLAREETKDKQHPGVTWLAEGGRNIGFFPCADKRIGTS